jgi:hypothetical protein
LLFLFKLIAEPSRMNRHHIETYEIWKWVTFIGINIKKERKKCHEDDKIKTGNILIETNKTF